jgi:lysophospholipase
MAFVRVPGNLEPEGAQELSLEGRGGVKLRAMLAPALTGSPRGSVIVCQGRTEFIEKYFEIARDLQSRGFVVFTFDWRGQGLSDRETDNPLKGHLESMDDPVQDLGDAIKHLGAQLPKPHLVIAHSMGGGIALRAMQTRRLEPDAALFSAPMWGILSLKDFTLKFVRFMASVGAGKMFAPGVETTWKKESFKKNLVTHDKERHARGQSLIQAEPRLALAGPTIGWVNAAADAFEGFRRPSALANLRMPITVLSAGQEALVSNLAHGELAKLLPNAQHIVIDAARHEIMMETDPVRAQFWAAFDRLAEAVAPPQLSAAPVA